MWTIWITFFTFSGLTNEFTLWIKVQDGFFSWDKPEVKILKLLSLLSYYIKCGYDFLGCASASPPPRLLFVLYCTHTSLSFTVLFTAAFQFHSLFLSLVLCITLCFYPAHLPLSPFSPPPSPVVILPAPFSHLLSISLLSVSPFSFLISSVTLSFPPPLHQGGD